MNKSIFGKVYNFKLEVNNFNWSIDNEVYSFWTHSIIDATSMSSNINSLKSSIINRDIDAIVYDKKNKKLFIYKSFFSKSPIYYHSTGDSFIWSDSLPQIKSFCKNDLEINKQALSLFFSLTYIPPPYTIYEGINKLPNNHVLILDCTELSLSVDELSDNTVSVDKNISFLEAKKQTFEKVMHSVENLNKNNFGSLLSGGVDSAVISYCFSKVSNNPIKTLSLGFENNKYDESEAAKTVAKSINSEHYAIYLNKEETINQLDYILNLVAEPFADSSLLPSYIIAKEAKKHVSGVLTGDGGDEVFGGYNKYYIGKLNNMYTKFIPSKIHDFLLNKSELFLKKKKDVSGLTFKANKAISSFSYKNDFYYNVISLGFKQKDLEVLFNNAYNIGDTVFDFYKNGMPKVSTIHDFRKVDYKISLQGDMISKVYHANKAVGLDYHSPFMNKDLWFFANSLPENFLMKGWNKKYILKEAFKEYFPKNHFNLPKKGFGIPVGDWLRNELKEELLTFIAIDFLEAQAIFHIAKIQEIVENHISGKVDNSFKVWTFYCFQKWYLNNFE